MRGIGNRGARDHRAESFGAGDAGYHPTMGRDTSMNGRSSVLVVPAQTASIAAARHFVRTHLGEGVAEHRLDDIVLAASELVSNAVEHGAGQDIEVRVTIGDSGFDLAVASASLDLPHIPNTPAAADALRGRGLHIVATLSDAIGIDASGGVVSVICHFDAIDTG